MEENHLRQTIERLDARCNALEFAIFALALRSASNPNTPGISLVSQFFDLAQELAARPTGPLVNKSPEEISATQRALADFIARTTR